MGKGALAQPAVGVGTGTLLSGTLGALGQGGGLGFGGLGEAGTSGQ